MAFEVVKTTYGLAVPDLDAAQVAQVIDDAIGRAREKHPDFERFELAIEFLSTVFFTDHVRMPIDDYFETLYCGVKHGDFSKNWRLKLRGMNKAKEPDPSAVQ